MIKEKVQKINNRPKGHPLYRLFAATKYYWWEEKYQGEVVQKSKCYMSPALRLQQTSDQLRVGTCAMVVLETNFFLNQSTHGHVTKFLQSRQHIHI